MDKNVNDIWNDFHKFCTERASIHLGVSKGIARENKDPSFWKPDVQKKIQRKKTCFKTWQQTGSDEDKGTYWCAKREVKRAVAQARASNREDLYAKLENAANDKELFKIAKQRNHDTQDTSVTKYIKDLQGNLLTTNEDIKKRWHEYYSHLLNETYPCEPIPESQPTEGPWEEITPMEVKTSVMKMANNKATGPDDIPAELWKALKDNGVYFLRNLFNKIQREGIPDAWRRSYLVPFFKNKGDVRQCGNYRAIKLISHAFKIWERVLNERVRKLITITENQCGFVPGKSTTDAIHTVRILMQTYRTRKSDLHMVFIDLEKAFDRVPRPLIWQALRSQNLPECYIELIRDMYAGAITRVRCPAGISEEFQVQVGVHQGSALSPLLFNIVMNYLTANIQRSVPWNILYADDVVLIDEDPVALQAELEKWRLALETAGLRISREKTEHLHCNFSNNNAQHNITLQNVTLKTVEQFKYLGSVLSGDGNIDADITHRANTGWQKWRELTGVLCDSQMPIRTKGKVYKTAVRPAMTYGAECWPITKAQTNKVHVNEMRMLRWSAGISLLDKVPNVYIRGSFKVRPIPQKLQEKRLEWYGHVMRRPEEHMTKRVLHLEPGPRGRGRPRPTWMSVIKQDLANNNLDPTTIQNRCLWRRRIRRADPN